MRTGHSTGNPDQEPGSRATEAISIPAAETFVNKNFRLPVQQDLTGTGWAVLKRYHSGGASKGRSVALGKTLVLRWDCRSIPVGVFYLCARIPFQRRPL